MREILDALYPYKLLPLSFPFSKKYLYIFKWGNYSRGNYPIFLDTPMRTVFKISSDIYLKTNRTFFFQISYYQSTSHYFYT